VLQGSQSELFATPKPPSVDNDPAFGPEDAKVTMIEFSDFQCSYCKEFFDQTYFRLKQNYGDTVRFVYRDFPMTNVHPEAQAAAEAAECAHEQGRFWEYHDALFTHQDKLGANYYFELAQQLGLDPDTFGQCLRGGKYTLEVANDFGDGLNSGVQGTPTFYINGRMVVGAQPYDVFKQVIDEELAK
jgi:protein-disulfide isomerase